MPRNASLDGAGFRYYEWTEPGQEPVRLLSVTSIRRLVGISHMLVEWQLGNVTRLVMGIRKQTVIGPRGGVKEVYVKDGPFPGEFVRRLLETEGEQKKLDEVRKWVRATADEPRDVAAVRGSVVHKLIETNVKMDRLEDDTIITHHFENEWKREKRKIVPDITEDDLRFVRNAMRQYWHFRRQMPFVILAQEPQVFNLTAGYSGSADVLIWFLGHFEEGPDGEQVFVPLDLPPGQDLAYWQREASAGRVSVETIARVGGKVCLGDWKTSKGVYTDHVVQTTAYMAGEFIGGDGKRDDRLTALLEAMVDGVIVHIRPDGVVVDFLEFRHDVLRAFLGSVMFARFLAAYGSPEELFTASLKFSADDTEPSTYVEEGAA